MHPRLALATALLAVAPAARAQAVCPNGPLAPGEDCERWADCCPAGTRCFRKTGSFAGCLASCPASGYDDGDGVVWFCTELSCSSGMPVYPAVDNSGAVGRHGKPRLEGLQLVDQAGAPMQLVGMMSSDSGTSACLRGEALRTFSTSWGINAVTIRVSASQNDQVAPVPLDDINRVKDAVSNALAAGMYAIINFGVLNPGDPNDFLTSVSPPAGPAIDFWREIATTYKDRAHVLYEIAGKPNEGALGPTWSRLKRYHDAVIGEIRKIDPATVILAGTPWFNQYLAGPVEEPVAQPANVMYTTMFAAKSESLGVIKNRIEPYRKAIPIFVQNVKAQDHYGSAGPRLEVLKPALDFLGPQPDAPTISWVMTEMDDRGQNEDHFLPGACSAKEYDQLTCSGYFVRNYIRFTKQGVPTLAPTESPTKSPTESPTKSPSFAPSRLGDTPRPSMVPTLAQPGSGDGGGDGDGDLGSPSEGAPTIAPTSPAASNIDFMTLALVLSGAALLCVGTGVIAGRRAKHRRSEQVSGPWAAKGREFSGFMDDATDASSVETGSIRSNLTMGSYPGSHHLSARSALTREMDIAERARPPSSAPEADWRLTRSSLMPSFAFRRFAPSLFSVPRDTDSRRTFGSHAW